MGNLDAYETVVENETQDVASNHHDSATQNHTPDETKVTKSPKSPKSDLQNGDCVKIVTQNGFAKMETVDLENGNKGSSGTGCNLYNWEARGGVQLRECDVDVEPTTVPAVLHQVAQKLPNHPALATRIGTDKEWKMITFSEYLQLVRTVAKAFIKLGLERYHSVSILGMNSPEWFISDLAAIMAGGFACGIYTTNSADAALHCMKISSTDIVVVENDFQLQKILQVRHQMPSLKKIIQYTGKPTSPDILSWQELLDIGKQESDHTLDAIIKDQSPNKCCTLVFTSGTTSYPKAVMLSHDNVIFNTKMVVKYLGLGFGCERVMSYLPLSHAAAQSADLYMGVVVGATVYFSDKEALKGAFVENVKSIKPTFLFGVPRVWEKIKEGLEAAEKKAPRLKQYLMSYARSVGLAHYKDFTSSRQNTESLSMKLCRRLVHNKVKAILGFDQCKLFLSGAAPVPVEVREFLSGYDIPLGQGYGMSETAAAHALSKSDDFSFESAGRTLPGCKTKICDPDANGVGEVCMYGRNIFMGYLNDPEKTEEAIDSEGWLHSGDLGKIDHEGFVQITGRLKDLIITKGGENVAPSIIEMDIKKELPVLSQAVVIGDNKKYLSVLLTLKCKMDLETMTSLDELAPETIDWCKSLGCSCTKLSEILNNRPKSVHEAIEEGLERVNRKAISSAQKIQKFAILPRDFSVATGELGPTMKVMRRFVYDNFKEYIDNLYK